MAAPTSSIRFEDVVFGYNKDRQVLKRITFEVPAGKKVAIVGASGSGWVGSCGGGRGGGSCGGGRGGGSCGGGRGGGSCGGGVLLGSF